MRNRRGKRKSFPALSFSRSLDPSPPASQIGSRLEPGIERRRPQETAFSFQSDFNLVTFKLPFPCSQLFVSSHYKNTVVQDTVHSFKNRCIRDFLFARTMLAFDMSKIKLKSYRLGSP